MLPIEYSNDGVNYTDTKTASSAHARGRGGFRHLPQDRKIALV